MDSGIEILHETQEPVSQETDKLICPWIAAFLEHYCIRQAEVSVHLASSEAIRQLNREFRGKDYPTDILTFPQYETLDEIKEDAQSSLPVHLGDMIISVKEVEENCREFSVSFEEELPRLIIHGMLHMIGEVHHSYDKQEPMLSVQEELLKNLKKW